MYPTFPVNVTNLMDEEQLDCRRRLAPVALRRCRSASPLPHHSSFLSDDQKALIRKSWKRVPHSTIGKRIYQQMQSRCSDTSVVFGNDLLSVERHLKYFVELIQCAVDNLDNIKEALEPWLSTIGKGHAGFSIRYTFPTVSLEKML
ncbi:hypothetical protein AB6A40_011270 [Gnathostoma spinigerum]|uniref:Globin family profile domain-containing protein n=1 Tax=Gnathostoma spinigerum TaxID=75299 RepID=A0ABD6EXC1_9BILA